MGSYISKSIEERQRSAYIQQQLFQIKLEKQKRDYQLASRVAMLRDRTYWMTAFYITMGAVSMGRMIYIRRFDALPLRIVPYVLVPFMVGYQMDAAWGTKLNRIDRLAREILKEDNGRWWFNEPLVLPEILKPHYRAMVTKNNELLAEMGKPLEKEWAK